MVRHLNRKLLAVISVLAFILLVAACGGEDTASESEAGEDGAEESPDDSDSGDEEADGEESDDSAEDFDAEAHFSGQTVRFVTTSGPGGGTDRKNRVLAEYLPQYLPGNPDGQASNQEPHVAGMNFLFESEPDGMTVGVTSAPPLEFELFDEAQWDSSEFRYIGGMDASCGDMLLMDGDLPYEGIDDAEGSEEPALISQTSSPAPDEIEPHDLGLMLIAEYLELPLEIRRVAESGQDAMNIAFQRDEITLGRYGASWCILPETNPGWLEDGFLVPLLDINPGGPAPAPDVIEEPAPHLSEVISEDEWEEWRGMVAAPRQGGNAVFLPPETPDEVVEAFREAFAEAQEDEEFLEAMSDAFGVSDLEYAPGEEFQALMEENHELMHEYAPDVQAKTEELYEEYVN